MQSSHETLNIAEKKQAEVGIEETVVTDDTNRDKIQVVSGGGEIQKKEHLSKKDSSSLSSSSSSSESEEESGEYRPHQRMTQDAIKEELEENEAAREEEAEHKTEGVTCVEISQEICPVKVTVEHTQVTEASVEANEVSSKTSGETNLPKLDEQGHIKEREEEQLKVNGEASHIDIDVSPQIICCSEVNGRRGRDPRLHHRVKYLCLSSSLSFSSFQINSDVEGEKTMCSQILPSVIASEFLLYLFWFPRRVNLPRNISSYLFKFFML